MLGAVMTDLWESLRRSLASISNVWEKSRGREGGREGEEGREGGREEGREGGREGGRERQREGGREEKTEGGKEGGRVGGRERGREGGRDRGRGRERDTGGRGVGGRNQGNMTSIQTHIMTRVPGKQEQLNTLWSYLVSSLAHTF